VLVIIRAKLEFIQDDERPTAGRRRFYTTESFSKTTISELRYAYKQNCIALRQKHNKSAIEMGVLNLRLKTRNNYFFETASVNENTFIMYNHTTNEEIPMKVCCSAVDVPYPFKHAQVKPRKYNEGGVNMIDLIVWDQEAFMESLDRKEDVCLYINDDRILETVSKPRAGLSLFLLPIS
jgi:hypothetical protein